MFSFYDASPGLEYSHILCSYENENMKMHHSHPARQILSFFHSKNNLNIDLGKCSGHSDEIKIVRKYHPFRVLKTNLLIYYNNVSHSGFIALKKEPKNVLFTHSHFAMRLINLILYLIPGNNVFYSDAMSN